MRFSGVEGPCDLLVLCSRSRGKMRYDKAEPWPASGVLPANQTEDAQRSPFPDNPSRDKVSSEGTPCIMAVNCGVPGPGVGKPQTGAKFSGAAVNEVVLKGSWP